MGMGMGMGMEEVTRFCGFDGFMTTGASKCPQTSGSSPVQSSPVAATAAGGASKSAIDWVPA